MRQEKKSIHSVSATNNRRTRRNKLPQFDQNMRMYSYSLILFVMSSAVPLCVPHYDCSEPPRASDQLYASYEYSGFFLSARTQMGDAPLVTSRQAESFFVSRLRFLENSLKIFFRGVTEKPMCYLAAYR